MSVDADVIIVGSGAAGLTAALNLAETHNVAVIAKGALGDTASARAQGESRTIDRAARRR